MKENSKLKIILNVISEKNTIEELSNKGEKDN